jgi:hypothetical protein
LLAPVLWPLALPIWAWVLWREHVEERRYFERPVVLDPEAPVELVPAGIPYGSPVPFDSLLAKDICIRHSGSRCP